jgi:hypothetical protein
MNRARALRVLARALKGQAPSKREWPDLIALGGEQLVLATLWRRLQATGCVAPTEVRTLLDEVQKRTRERNARLFAALETVLAQLNRVGVEPVLLKGAALWALAPDPGAAARASDRLLSDLDLLVRSAELEIAVKALLDGGFAMLEDHRADEEHNVAVFGRTSDPGAVDLHQQPPSASHAPALAAIHDASTPVCIGNTTAKAPPPELIVLTTVLHDQVHDAQMWFGGFDIRHLIDFAELASRDVDWQKLLSMCSSPLVRTALAAQAQAARDIAGAALPDEICGGFWAAMQYRRQRLQYEHPLFDGVIDYMRTQKWLSGARRAFWRMSLRQVAIPGF